MLIVLSVVVALLGAVATAGAVGLRAPGPARRQLLLWFGVALTLRVVLAVVLHQYEGWRITTRGAVTPDEAVIDYAARLILGGDERSPKVLGGSLHTAWLLVAATVYELWNNMLALQLLNALLGALLVVPAYVIGARLHSQRAGVLSAAALALFPNAVVWSALALREPMVALLVTTLLALGLNAVQSRQAVTTVLLSGGSLFLLGFSRGYMSLLLIVLVLVASVVAAASLRRLRPVAVAAAGGLLGIGLILVAPSGPDVVDSAVRTALSQAPSVYNPFADCTDPAACAADTSGPSSGAFTEPGVTTPRATKALGAPAPNAPPTKTGDPTLQSVGQKGVPRAFAIALLGGRPVWKTDQYYFLLQPGVVVWWAVLPLIGAGLVALAVRRRFGEFVLLGGFLAGMITFLALTGQFIRHHFMIEPVGLVLAVVGVLAVLEGGQQRWRRVTFGASALMGLAAVASVGVSLAG